MPSETPRVFSDEWGRRVETAINASSDYRQAAADWRDTLGLEMTDAPSEHPRAAILDLRNGQCHAVHTGADARTGEAAYLLCAGGAEWQSLLAGGLEPIWGIMSGRLRLARGNLAGLLPFAQAAKKLVEAIATVETTFPPALEEKERT